MSVKRAERLFHLTNILRSGPGYSAKELAGLTGVSLRTIYRDVVDLSMLVPVYYDQGYRLLQESFLANLAFTRDELFALRMGMKMAPLADASHLVAAARSALAKIEDQLTFRFADGQIPPDAISVHVAAYPLTLAALRILKALEEAIQERRTVRFKYYATYRDEYTERDADPYGLTFRGRTWYLVGYCHLRRTERVFRLDRISHVTATPRRFERPASFSVEKFFEGSWDVYAATAGAQAKICFAPQLAAFVTPPLSRRGRLHEDRKARALVFEGEVPVTDEFVRWLVTFGGEAEVLAPPELRAAVADKARAIVARYEPAAEAAPPPKRKPRPSRRKA
jgi:predicted DNA-binding transcriptional regulator YafY